MIYYRLDPVATNLQTLDLASSSPNDSSLILKVKPKNNIVLAKWDSTEKIGLVTALGVVLSVAPDHNTTKVTWRSVDITLRPNPSGRRYWAQPKPWFVFASDVAVRYGLADLFAEHFPDLDDLEFGKLHLHTPS